MNSINSFNTLHAQNFLDFYKLDYVNTKYVFLEKDVKYNKEWLNHYPFVFVNHQNIEKLVNTRKYFIYCNNEITSDELVKKCKNMDMFTMENNPIKLMCMENAPDDKNVIHFIEITPKSDNEILLSTINYKSIVRFGKLNNKKVLIVDEICFDLIENKNVEIFIHYKMIHTLPPNRKICLYFTNLDDAQNFNHVCQILKGSKYGTVFSVWCISHYQLPNQPKTKFIFVRMSPYHEPILQYI